MRLQIVPFDPALEPHDGLLRYQDGRVSGIIDLVADQAVIYEWSSSMKGLGHTKEALRWLRDQGACNITAFNMGMPPEEGAEIDGHVAYWLHMRDLGLVNTLIDDEGNVFDESWRRKIDSNLTRKLKKELDDAYTL
ncbi:hypothetical protein IFT69_15150 [Pseudomonas putida]|nr:hypothetical protein [Pseudomonas putida]